MGRPPRHTSDDLLDAAVRLVAAHGARAVTMSGLAREAGAPSGSVYHRFADRPALLAALWLRTVRRFHDGYLAALAGEPPVEAAIAAVERGVRWCVRHPGEALVLNAGRAAFDHSSWSAVDTAAAAHTDAELRAALRTACRRLRQHTGRDTEELLLVLVDLPLAAIRRHLEAGKPVRENTVSAVVRAARLLLNAEGTDHDRGE
ncbi:helix-turn-helix domain-containing protein [Saccharomonospora sp. NPDC006951]